MTEEYNPQEIEKSSQAFWEQSQKNPRKLFGSKVRLI